MDPFVGINDSRGPWPLHPAAAARRQAKQQFELYIWQEKMDFSGKRRKRDETFYAAETRLALRAFQAEMDAELFGRLL